MEGTLGLLYIEVFFSCDFGTSDFFLLCKQHQITLPILLIIQPLHKLPVFMVSFLLLLLIIITKIVLLNNRQQLQYNLADLLSCLLLGSRIEPKLNHCLDRVQNNHHQWIRGEPMHVLLPRNILEAVSL